MTGDSLLNIQGESQDQQASEKTVVAITCNIWPSCLGRALKLCCCNATGPELDAHEHERLLIQIAIDALLFRNVPGFPEGQKTPVDQVDACWTFISEAKKTIIDHESYINFLKLFELHVQNRLDRDLIVDRAAAFIGHNTDLMATLKTMIEYESGDVAIAGRSAQSMAVINIKACLNVNSPYCDTAFFGKVKQTINNDWCYDEFLQLCDSYSRGVIDQNVLINRTRAFLDGCSELMDYLKGMVLYDPAQEVMPARNWLQCLEIEDDMERFFACEEYSKFWQRSMVTCYDQVDQTAQNDNIASATPVEHASTVVGQVVADGGASNDKDSASGAEEYNRAMVENLCGENERVHEGLYDDECCDEKSSALSEEFELIDDGGDLEGNAPEETGLEESTCIAKMFEYVRKTFSRKAGHTKEIANISAPIPIMVPTIDPITGTTFRSPFVAMPNGLYAINGLASTPIVYSHRALWDPTTCSWVFMHEKTMVVSMDWPSNAKVKPEKGVVIGTKDGLDKNGKKIIERVILWPTETGRANPNHADPFVDAPPPSADLTTLSVLNGEAGPAIGVNTRAPRRPKKSSHRK